MISVNLLPEEYRRRAKSPIGMIAATGRPVRRSRVPAAYMARQPHVTHRLPEFSARMYERVPGVGEVGWGEPWEGVQPAWHFGPEHAVAARAEWKGGATT